eukprot:9298436-Prorocentrum_lima.AAC.1
MSTAAPGLTADQIRATITESVKDAVAIAVSAGFKEHGHALEALNRDVKDVYSMIAAHQEDTNVIKERIAELTKQMDQIES